MILSCGALSCVTIGEGSRTVIKHRTDDPLLQGRYPHLVASTRAADAERVARFDEGEVEEGNARNGVVQLADFHAYMERKYGDSHFVPLALRATVRDRTTVPAFLPVDLKKHLAAVLLASSELNLEERRQRFSVLVNQPDLYDSTARHGTVDGVPVYWYYPRLSVDFSAGVLAALPQDRLSFLLLIIRLRQPKGCDIPIRFLDFAPKEADFVDFTRGNFTQALQLAVSADGSLVNTSQVTESAESQTTTGQTGFRLSPSLVFSESYANSLRDAIERRSTGLHDESTFYATFRSLREVRIGGTYSFDLMLEVPAKEGVCSDELEKKGLRVWEPVADQVRADILMLGVVRHVYDLGRTGVRVRVPEPENDNVYEQVVVEVVEDVVLWEFSGEPWVGSTTISEAECRVDVFTNREDALFLLENDHAEVQGSGSGTRASVKYPPSGEGGCSTTIRFLPIVDVRGSSGAAALQADDVVLEMEGKDSGSAVGVYRWIEQEGVDREPDE